MTTFAPLFVPARVREAVSDRAWLQAMLDAEAALAAACAAAGLVPLPAAARIAAACRAERFDVDALAEAGRATANPVEPLVRALRAALDEEAAPHVHRGATSQDVLDTAAMLVARDALALVLEELDGLAGACAALARAHRDTPVVGRTLLQQAVPTTFGAKAAVWLVAAVDARTRLAALRDGRLAVQLGGAAGTLAALGGHGLEVLAGFAAELGLAEPVVPWHADRSRVAELGSALAAAAAVAAKVGLDVALLAQSEVAEVAEGSGGGSSTMPHKRNPAAAVRARACAAQAYGHVAVLTGAPTVEHERAAGGWQAEWPALSGALALTAGAVAAARESLEGLTVHVARMRANLDASGGLILTERLAALVGAAVVRDAVASGRPLREALLADARVTLDAAGVDAALDPTGYLGCAPQLVDRALAYAAAS